MIHHPETTMTSLALIGAGGKMGCRIVDHLQANPAYSLRCLETGERGLALLAARGLQPMDPAVALPDADVVVLAVPDRLLGRVAHDTVPRLKPGALVITLDPAAAHAGEFPARPDISYFVTHPCHPSVFDHEEDPAARADFFGGTRARMPIVCALMQGPEAHYALGEQLARDFFAPVTRSHQMKYDWGRSANSSQKLHTVSSGVTPSLSTAGWPHSCSRMRISSAIGG